MKKILKILIFLSLPLSPPLLTSAAPNQEGQNGIWLEGEGAVEYDGVVETNHSGFRGIGFLNLFNKKGSEARWRIQNSPGGTHTLVFRFANGSRKNRSMTLTINGKTTRKSIPFFFTKGWKSWKDQVVKTRLPKGQVEISLSADMLEGGPNLDYIQVVEGKYRGELDKAVDPAKLNLPKNPVIYGEKCVPCQ